MALLISACSAVFTGLYWWEARGSRLLQCPFVAATAKTTDHVVFSFANLGTSRAVDIKVSFIEVQSPNEESLRGSFGMSPKASAQWLELAPSSSVDYVYGDLSGVQQSFSGITAGNSIYVYGTVSFSDIARTRYSNTFCYVFQKPEPSAFYRCNLYNVQQ